MIESIKHKGLKRLWEKNDASKVNPEHVQRLKSRLSLLAAAKVVTDMDRPGLRLHSLQGYENRWAINVSGNWRLTFDFVDGNAYLIDYEDYH